MLVLRLLNNYSRILMSVVPTKTLPKCTRTIVLDTLFQEKYDLTYTQTCVMYYLLLLRTWVTYKEDDYCVILSSKIEKDLRLHPKTVEASLTRLKQLDLIKTKRCIVKDWEASKSFRGIAITELGKEYSLSHYKEEQHQHTLELEKENEIYRVENDAIYAQNMELERIQKALEAENSILNMQLEAEDRLNQDAIKALEENRALKEKNLSLELKVAELEKRLELTENLSKEEEKQKEKDIEDFRDKIIRKYARSGKAICNGVKNSDGWLIETKFYINAYSRLTTYLPNDKKPKLIDEPKQVENFWRWLFDHQHRVDNLVDEKKVADISSLTPYLGATISQNNTLYRIEKFKAVIGGVKILISNEEGALSTMGNSYGGHIIDVIRSTAWLKKFSRRLNE